MFVQKESKWQEGLEICIGITQPTWYVLFCPFHRILSPASPLSLAPGSPEHHSPTPILPLPYHALLPSSPLLSPSFSPLSFSPSSSLPTPAPLAPPSLSPSLLILLILILLLPPHLHPPPSHPHNPPHSISICSIL
ncbi:hypothetical protein JAAARDRAFT_32611 [Jaapia argillacea MUCL 33604]|uniref:Uncharacterized protein n=1 Tax=Jaapia argillacea MUCL 33604 TaxID=933084 RepID=A0A067Q253_9AGAM|nr:hypothetical protein JAAARDRAFT_32611 [Jaapia argillacea MUCL 33604]